MSNKVTAAQIAARLRAAERILLLTHVSPDGDTLGSAYGLKHALPDRHVDIVCDDTVGEWISFVCVPSLPLRYYEVNAQDYDLVVSIDVAEFARLGEGAQSLGREVDIKIDHHETGKPFSKEELVVPDAAACAEIIYDIVCELGTMNPLCATALYAALSSDTGGFRYESTTEGTHHIAAALIAAGCDHADIDHRLFESRTRGEVAAIRFFWANLQFYLDGRVAAVLLTNADKERYGIPEEDIGVLASMTREIAGVELGIVIKQGARHGEQYKISLRSGKSVASNVICAHFGGGGHLRAAGATVTADSAEDVLALVLEQAKEQLS